MGQDQKFDVSIAVTAHSESVVAGPTMRSAEAAATAAAQAGLSVEKLIGLDSATPACASYFQQIAFKDWRIIELSEADLGMSRNALAKVSEAAIIAFLDADDLFSENWVKDGVDLIRRCDDRSEKVILHPEINWFFDAHQSILGNISDKEFIYTPYYYFCRNYYDSLVLAPRNAFLETPYLRRDKKLGFGYEDWRWNLDTRSVGWSHRIVPDTIIFKRRQDVSLVTELGKTRSLLWPTEALKIGATPELETSYKDKISVE